MEIGYLHQVEIKTEQTNVGVPVGRVKISLFIGTAVAATIFATIQVLDAGSADTMRGNFKRIRGNCSCCSWRMSCLPVDMDQLLAQLLEQLIFGTVSMGIFYTDVDTDWFKVFLGAMMLNSCNI